MTKVNKSELILYQAEDGKTQVEVRLQNDTVWLTQAGMAELYQTTPQNITLHLKAIYSEEELDESATCKEYLQVQKEGSRQINRKRKFYNLPAILAVGYRVRSHRGTQFRRWATEHLNEYLVKGFTLDDNRLKEGTNIGSDYFDEILERIRDIRSSEKRFYQKIRDIYKSAVDYDPKAEETLKNALLSQLWVALIAYLMLSYLKFRSKFQWSVYTLMEILPVNIFSRRHIWDWLNDPYHQQSASKPPGNLQLNFNFV